MTRWDTDNLNAAHTQRELQQEWGGNVELNLSGWIDRRKRDVGPYADHIIKGVSDYEQRIEQLERELAAYMLATQHANDHADAAIADLAAEKALADRLMKNVHCTYQCVIKAVDNDNDECTCGCYETQAAHRKARGL